MASNRRQRRAEAKRAGSASQADADAVLAAAFDHIGKGEFADADRMIGRVLAVYPRNADALHLRGVIAYQIGNVEAALDLLNKAIKAAPKSGQITGTLAVVYDSIGNQQSAEKAYRKALTFTPHDLGIRNNYGGFLKSTGKLDEAEAAFREAVRTDPTNVQSLSNLAALLAETGRLDDAETLFRKAIDTAPDNTELQSDLAVVLQQKGNLDETKSILESVLSQNPENIPALINLASVHFDAETFQEGEAVARKAVDAAPDNAVALNNLGNILTALNRFEEAESVFRGAAKIAPNDAQTASNLGHLLKSMGRGEDAATEFRRALSLDKNGSRHAYGLSLALLMTGDIDEAWTYHEAGFACGERQPDRRAETEQWTGQPLEGKSILIWPEQGIGDEVRFAGCFNSFLEPIPDSTTVRIECDARLVSIFARSFPKATVRAVGETDPAQVDFQISSGQLTERLRPTVDAFADAGSFLLPDPTLSRKWRDRLNAMGSNKKVGLAWTSGMTGNRRDQSLTRLSDWTGLFNIDGVDIVNLQYGDVEDDILAFEQSNTSAVIRWDDLSLKDDLDDVFALVGELDAVACLATSPADFAGSLGTPAFALTADGDWVSLGTDHHPWYPSVRLFHRRHFQDWSDPIAKLLDALTSEVRKSA